MTSLWFAQALLPNGWARDVRLTIEKGRIADLAVGVPAGQGDLCGATALPGLPNLHSHAFQRAMAGLAEAPGGAGRDDFWSWRDLMYRLVAELTPDDCAAIAAMAFMEMLESGFTRVGEFHYLHHAPDGGRYDNPAEMAFAIAGAAAETGMALTLLPVFYAHAGFGGLDPRPQQRRFVSDMDCFAKLIEGARSALVGLPDAVLGIAPHSLRAVTPDELLALLDLSPSGPVHIHVAEQTAEVEACLAWSGARPVRWLMDHMPVDDRWCLVHATHVETNELDAMVRVKAVVGLCPITEANLGDGLFPCERFVKAGGRIGLGSDSNVRIDAAEEMRLLEYSQRLALKQRNVMAGGAHSTGRSLFDAAFAGGSQALGLEPRGLTTGAPADIVALTADPVGMEDRSLDRWIFARDASRVDMVWHAGAAVVVDGRHIHRDIIEARFEALLRRIAL